MTTRGSWPYVDVVLVKDYEQTKAPKPKAKCMVRIHMDIEFDERDAPDVDKWLSESDHQKVFDKLVPKGSQTDPRGLATLKAALDVP
jgi:hypothetical protein